ncbi:helix-turn-helix transcriptional regulator [Paractinoplanes maris]|uniref:helix-turn-helix transcriptional regulator n=1 Tax=Paractinoplanes maris TaxID=1734446 RepID=UPI002021F93F|nr:AlpA family phage regulatory protein [Actinoplanes maris]
MDTQDLCLVGAHEIRDLLGVSRQRVYQLAGRSDFPKPVAELTQGKIWSLNDIETWIETHRSAGRQR